MPERAPLHPRDDHNLSDGGAQASEDTSDGEIQDPEESMECGAEEQSIENESEAREARSLDRAQRLAEAFHRSTGTRSDIEALTHSAVEALKTPAACKILAGLQPADREEVEQEYLIRLVFTAKKSEMMPTCAFMMTPLKWLRDTHLRKKRNLPDNESQLEIDFDGTLQDEPVDHLEGEDVSTKLNEAFEQLPSDYRAVWELKHVKGLKHAEIAKALGKTVPATRSILGRTTAYLRDNPGLKKLADQILGSTRKHLPPPGKEFPEELG